VLPIGSLAIVIAVVEGRTKEAPMGSKITSELYWLEIQTKYVLFLKAPMGASWVLAAMTS
jgi:hypothetical protein